MSGVTLLTGATGFVGSHAAEALAEDGHDLRCTVRESSDLRWIEGLEAEITVWSVNARTPAEPPRAIPPATERKRVDATDTRSLFDPKQCRQVDAAVINRADLSPGDVVRGPALVTEAETTVVLPSGREVVAHTDGTLDVCVALTSATKETADA